MKSNNLAKMIGKRVVQSCITILLVTLFVFALIQMVPGDPVANYLGATATEEQITYYRHLYGFDRPVIVQYLSWIGGLFRGTMGQSISYQSEIADIILPRLGTTLTMVIPAFIIGTITGILFGIIAAKNRGKVIDSVISFFANIGVSMPMFWLGMMGMLVFALKLRVLPSSGYVPITRDFGGWLSHMIMPIIVLSLGVNAGFVRLTRSSMLEVMRQDYVTTARAKGVSKKDVTFRHQLRNSMIPIVTTMGMRLGSMVGSTVLIESLFVIPGLGSVMMNGISNRDFMLVVCSSSPSLLPSATSWSISCTASSIPAPAKRRNELWKTRQKRRVCWSVSRPPACSGSCSAARSSWSAQFCFSSWCSSPSLLR